MTTASLDRLRQALSKGPVEAIAIGPRAIKARAIVNFLAPFALAAGGLWVAHATGLGTEAAGASYQAFSTPTAPQTQSARFLSLPQSPFIEAGRLASGALDSSRMLSAWQQAGITEEQANDIVDRLDPLSPVVLGVNDPGLEKDLIQAAHRAATDLAQDYPDAARALSTVTPATDLPEQSSDTWYTARQALARQADLSRLPDADGNAFAFQKARRALAQATSSSGLAALRVPLANTASPTHLEHLAHTVRAANADLQRATGWSHGVLGLGGRIMLTIGSPQGDGSGLTGKSWSGPVAIVSTREALGHEWSHALDMTVAQAVFSNPLPRTVSGQDGPLRQLSSPDMLTAWHAHENALRAASPQWTHANHDRFLNRLYISNQSEMNARAFAAFLNPQAKVLDMGSMQPRADMSAALYPQGAELTQANATWSQLFQDLAPLNLSHSPHAPALEADRYQEAAAPLPTPKDSVPQGYALADVVAQQEASLRQSGATEQQIDTLLGPLREQLSEPKRRPSLR